MGRKTFKNRAISLFLAFLMVLSVIPPGDLAYAAELLTDPPAAKPAIKLESADRICENRRSWENCSECQRRGTGGGTKRKDTDRFDFSGNAGSAAEFQ